MRRRYHARRGGVFIYCSVMMAVLLGFASLAVEVGRVQCAKTELRRAATAAARAAAAELGNSLSAVQSVAQQYAAANTADGVPVAIDTSDDVEVGVWDGTAKTFTPGSFATANAVRVWCRRTAARGNAIQLALARAVGKNSFDLTVNSVAVAAPRAGAAPAGFVGLDACTVSNAYTDSFDSSTYAYIYRGMTFYFGNRGGLASNADIYLNGFTTVIGDANPGVGKSVRGGFVFGSRSPLPAALSYPSAQAPGGQGDNAQITVSGGTMDGVNLTVNAGGTATLPAGTYVLNKLSCAGTLNFTGVATVYVRGPFSLTGDVNTFGNRPGNLTIIGVTSTMTIAPTADTYADIFNPGGSVTYAGGPHDFFGQIIAQSLTVNGGLLHYDTVLPAHNPIGGGTGGSGGGAGGIGTAQ